LNEAVISGDLKINGNYPFKRIYKSEGKGILERVKRIGG